MSDVTLQGEFGQGGAPIVESGSNANGEYIKYADGTMICTRTNSFSSSASTSYGSLFRSGQIVGLDMPQTFTSLYFFNTSLESNNNIYWLTNDHTALATSSRWPGFYIISGTSRSSQSFTLKYIAIGRWK